MSKTKTRTRTKKKEFSIVMIGQLFFTFVE